MNKTIKRLIESYYTDSAEQLANALLFADKERKRYDKELSKRQEFLLSILGQKLFLRVSILTVGTFAPIPLSGLGLTIEDFMKFMKKNGLSEYREDLMKMLKLISEKYIRRQFMIVNDEVFTDIVFNSIDDMIDFFDIFLKSLNKAYKTKLTADSIDWKPITDKLKKFLF